MATRIHDNADSSGRYITQLQGGFGQYRRARFSGRDRLFADTPGGGAVVFRKEHAVSNLLIPPILDELLKGEAVALIPAAQLHQCVSGRLSILAGIVAANGLPAFGPVAADTTLELEKSITTLREPRPTLIDVWQGTP